MRTLSLSPIALAFAMSVATVAACATAAPTTPSRSDEGVAVPDDGFWERSGPGVWRYDLGVGLGSDVQLTAPGKGQGVVRVTLPPGASGARLRAITVMYAKNHREMEQPRGAASGAAVWRVHADEGGAPGRELFALPVTVDDADAAPLEEGNAGVRHALPTPVAVPATFWLVFERVTGDPRVGAMRLIGDAAATYRDLYFRESPSAALGAPKNLRPYVALDFIDLGR